MTSKTKKTLPCDLCGDVHEAKNLFTAQRAFAGHKLIDLLETFTHSSLPANLPIKLCNVCAATIMSTVSVIKKVRAALERVMAIPAKKGKVSKAAEKEQHERQDSEPMQDTVDLTAECEKMTPKPKKNTTIRQRSKSMAAIPASIVFPKFAGMESIEASPKKLKGSPQKQLSRLIEDDLNDSVKLTPAKEVSSTKKAFLNLFGNGNDDAIELQTESEDDASKEGPVVINTNNFQCQECEFHIRFPNVFKEHLAKEHGQLRARIYACPLCAKSFGVLKTLKVHLQDVHSRTCESEKKTKAKETQAKSDENQKVVSKPNEVKTHNNKPKEIKTKDKSPQKPKEKHVNKAIADNQEEANETQVPKVASFKALNESLMKKRMLDSDYTFAINESSASTPRVEPSAFKCDICDCELTAVKQMQDHMKTAHGIEKPKIFKCHVCEKSLTSKQSLKTHLNLHTDGAEADKTGNRKILQEDEDVDIEGSFEVDNIVEDDEGPREEKIERETARKETSLNDVQTLYTMSAPQSPVKKAKKDESSFLDLSVASTNGETPSKAEKRKKKNKPVETTSSSEVDLLQEINHNVKPHKKARLESIGDSTADESILSCDQCGKFVSSRQRLHAHIKKKHGFHLKCSRCHEVYGNQMDYVGHFSDCTTDGRLPCGVDNCKKVFTEANYLGAHLRKRHHWT